MPRAAGRDGCAAHHGRRSGTDAGVQWLLGWADGGKEERRRMNHFRRGGAEKRWAYRMGGFLFWKKRRVDFSQRLDHDKT